jgi:hypothetical protein
VFIELAEKCVMLVLDKVYGHSLGISLMHGSSCLADDNLAHVLVNASRAEKKYGRVDLVVLAKGGTGR